MIPKKKPFFARLDGWVIFGVAALILAFMTSGCGEGLPKEIKKQAKAVPDTIKRASSQIDSMAKQYQDLSKSPEFKPLETFAEKEGWEKKFPLAKEGLKRAKDLYDKDLKPLVKKNKPEFANQVLQQIKRIQKTVDDAREVAQYPSKRFSNINDTIQNAAQIQSRSQKEALQISSIVEAAKTGVMAKALNDFPDITDKTRAHFSPFSKLGTESREHLKIVSHEFGRHSANGNADYAALTDSSQAIFNGLVTAKKLDTQFKKDVDQLYSSYTKILKDMKEELFVTIKRESWDENSDYYNPIFATFERQVTPEVYDALTENNLDSIGAISAGFSGSRFNSQVGDAWNKLKINPTENWPGKGHNAASFWVEDTRELYFHQYILEENGETTETGWEQVDESLYEANLEFLGMAILAKPYGVYEKDQLTQAAPPGMAYVGNSKYGEWQNDENGDRFWSWYGRYALFSSLFFFPPSYYYYNSWYGWHNNYRYSRPYFGKTKQGFQKYGTAGTYVKRSPKFQSTSFAKSGGFKSQAASVRGAGANLRGGGPKGKGK